MSKAAKIVIVVVLAVVVVGVIVMKMNAPPAPTGQPTVQSTGLPRLVDLGANECIPCKMMAPILAKLKNEYTGRLQVEVIDVWKEPQAGRQYGIRVIPTQIFYDGSGTELWRHEGFISKEDILVKWKELGFPFEAQ